MGSKTTIQQPAPPPSAAESMKNWAASLPISYEMQLKYAPLLAQQEVGLAQQYAGQYGQALKSAQEALYPEETAIGKKLSSQIATGLENPITDAMKKQYRDIYASELGSNVGSPMGANYMSSNMIGLQEGLRNNYQNMGLSLTGRQPITLANIPASSNLGYMSGYQPQSVLGYNAQNYGTYSNAMSNYNNIMANQISPWGSVLGSLAGGLSTGLGYGLGRRI